MNTALSLRLAAGFLLLILTSVSALPLLRINQQRRKLQDRISRHASPYARATPADAHPRNAKGSGSANGTRFVLGLLARLIAFDSAQSERYPLPWWMVFPAALLLAYLVILLAQGLVGRSALLGWPIMWGILIRSFYGWCEKRHLQRLFEQFPDALGILVRAVRVGIPISEGIRNVASDGPAPTAQEFALVVDQVALGVTLEEALRNLAARNPIPEYGFFATALALQSETGGTVSETLERLADVIRKRVALRERARALASEARTSIAILAALPILTGLALSVINRDYVSTLFTEPQGRRIFASAIALLATGVLTMRMIVSRSLS